MTALDKAGLVALAEQIEELGNDRSGALDWPVFKSVFGENDPRPQLRYTTSLDAAMTLVPAGWVLSMLTSSKAGSSWSAMLWVFDEWKEIEPPKGNAATPALALTAAALRAIAAGQP